MDTRAAAARTLSQVVQQGRSLDAALHTYQTKLRTAEDRALLQELCYGVLRWKARLDAVAAALLERPLRRKDGDVYQLLLVGLYQLLYTRVPPHAAVGATVSAAAELKRPWARGLINGVLRNFQRRGEALLAQVDQQQEAAFAHPRWLVRRVKEAWPDPWQAVLNANNERPPMALRVNPRHGDRQDYLTTLAELGIEAQAAGHTPQGILLAAPTDVHKLPGFAEGHVSVQDTAAQLTAPLLALAPGQRVLDACAAPGGKTGQILESEPELAEVWAVDKDERRVGRVRENLDRLGLQARIEVGDAADPQTWWDGAPFDRILIDAPCSGSGVIRRHPDIKWLRRDNDIQELAVEQRRLLENLWPLLAPGGMLVYVTCSILPEENWEQVAGFLADHDDARERPIEAAWGRAMAVGRQVLPGEEAMDGFYFAFLIKNCGNS